MTPADPEQNASRRQPTRSARQRLRLSGLAIALQLPAFGICAAPPADLAALMRTLGGVTQVQANYREVVESALLQQPLSSEGELHYQAPDRIRKRSGMGDEVDIQGDRISILQGSQRSDYSISDHESIQSFVLALRATFSGDLDRLESAYALAFQPASHGWALELRPKERRLLPFFERIRIEGADDRLDTIEILESNGDRRTMRLTGHRIDHANAGRRP